jgi:predicted ATP-dependent serine protease
LIRFKPFIPIISNRPQEVYPKFETTAELIKFAKETNIPVILIGHITKDGDIAQKILEHMVDTVLHLKATEIHVPHFAFLKIDLVPQPKLAFTKC